MTHQKEITWKDGSILVEFTYESGEREVRTYSNGDPGHPGSPPEYNIVRVWFEHKTKEGKTAYVDVINLFDSDDLDRMVDKIVSE